MAGENLNIGYSTKIDSKVRIIPREKLDASLAETFKNQRYRTVITKKDITAYRSFGNNADAGGSFATTKPFVNKSITMKKSAILPEWKNSLQYEARITIPKGTKLNIGRAEKQVSIDGTKYAGNGDQLLLPKNWDLNWIKEIRKVD